MSIQNPVFIPGPTNMPEVLRKACDMPTIDHRSPLFGEMLALVTILWIWLRVGGPFGGDSEGRRIRLYNLRVHWARHHLRGISALFGLRWEIEGLEDAGPGPVIAQVCAPVPVVRLPGTSKTVVHPSSIGKSA